MNVVQPTALRTCGQVIEKSGTHFINPLSVEHHSHTVESSVCSVSVEVPQSVCQLRLKLYSFNISQPSLDHNNRSRCNNDVFSINVGSRSIYPELCGENDGQHCKFLNHFSFLLIYTKSLRSPLAPCGTLCGQGFRRWNLIVSASFQ